MKLGVYLGKFKFLVFLDANFSTKTKHIAVKHHFVKDIIDKSQIVLNYISTKNQTADNLTKPVSCTIVNKCLSGMGLYV